MCNFISVSQTPRRMMWLRSSGRVHDVELCLPATLLWSIPARLFARGSGTVSSLQWLVLLSCPLCDQAGCIVFVMGKGHMPLSVCGHKLLLCSSLLLILVGDSRPCQERS